MWDFEFDRLRGTSTAGDLPRCCEAWLVEQSLEERMRRNRRLRPAHPAPTEALEPRSGFESGETAP